MEGQLYARDDFALLVQMVEVVKNLAADLATLRQKVRGAKDEELASSKEPIIQTLPRVVKLKLKAAPPKGRQAQSKGDNSQRERSTSDLRSPNQLASVPTPETWTKMLGRKEKKRAVRDVVKPQRQPQSQGGKPSTNKHGREKPGSVKVLRRSAVTLTTAPDSETTYAEVMNRAKENLNLSDAGIPDVRIRRSLEGGIILEIPRKDNITKANDLAGRFKVPSPSEDEVRICRPIKKAEVRVNGRLQTPPLPAEVAATVAAAGECDLFDVQIGNIRQPSPLSTLWLKFPAAATKKIAAI